jgi:hypothetical protein
MVSRQESPHFHAMKPLLLLSLILMLAAGRAVAQHSFKFIFQGMAYKTNAAGLMTATPITDQTLLADRAQAGGITDLSNLAIVYHVGADPKGDTIEIVDLTTKAVLAFQFGLWFGSEPSLQRSSAKNAAGTEERRVDYIYTMHNSTYTSQNSHSSGAAFVTKRFLQDTNGAIHTTIEGPMHWIVNPQGTNGTIICSGTFITGEPVF